MADEKEKKIEVNESTLREIVEANVILRKQVEANNAGAGRVLKRTREHTVRIRRVEDCYVIGWVNHARPDVDGVLRKTKFVYTKIDPEDPKREPVEYMDLILLGDDGKQKEEPLTMKYLDFLRETDSVQVKIKEKKREEQYEEKGMVKKKVWDEKSNMPMETDMYVPLEVVSDEVQFVVDLPNAGEYTIHSRFVNS